MKLSNLLTIGAVILSFTAGNALGQDEKAKKQAEIRKVTQASLQKFYKAKPEPKGEVEKAPGYAVFTTYGLSFLVGGAGGKGIAYDNKTKKHTFMHLAQASAGAQVGASESETLFVFPSQKALEDFVNNGWEANGRLGPGRRGGQVGRAGKRRDHECELLHAYQERAPGRPGGRGNEDLERQGAQLDSSAPGVAGDFRTPGKRAGSRAPQLAACTEPTCSSDPRKVSILFGS